MFACLLSVANCEVVEPPELLHISYFVDHPKVEVQPETTLESDHNVAGKSESKSSLRKSEVKVESEVKQEVKQPEVSKQEAPKEKKDVERPPIFVTLQ